MELLKHLSQRQYIDGEELKARIKIQEILSILTIKK